MDLARFLAVGVIALCTMSQAPNEPCGCGDVKDLQNLIAVSHAAIDRLRAEIPSATAANAAPTVLAPKDPETNPNGTLTNKDMLKNAIIKAQADVQDASARSGTGTTFFDCKPTVTADTPCLHSVLDVHEAVHVAQCNADKNNKQLKLGMWDDRWAKKLLVDYINEDIAAYQAAIDEAAKRLRALPKSCRPSGWVGTITAIQVMELNGTTVTPARTKYADPQTEIATNRLSRWGTIYFSSHPTATWNAQLLYTKTIHSGGLVACKGGLKTVPADHHVVKKTYNEVNGSGQSSAPPVVSLDFTVDKLYYTINVRLPAMKATVKMRGFTTESGGCADGTAPFPDVPVTESPLDATDSGDIKGQMRPNDDYIGGSKDIDLLPFKVAVPGTDKNEHVIRVVWHLHRFD
jgi:hypothetical protein